MDGYQLSQPDLFITTRYMYTYFCVSIFGVFLLVNNNSISFIIKKVTLKNCFKFIYF